MDGRLTPAKRPADDSVTTLAIVSKGDGEDEVQKCLEQLGLTRYLEKILEFGCRSLDALRKVTEKDLRQTVGMLLGHVRLLERHLGLRKVPPPTNTRKPLWQRPAATAAPKTLTKPESAAVPVMGLLDKVQKEYMEQFAPKVPAATQEKQDKQQGKDGPKASTELALMEPKPGPDDALMALAQLAEDSAQLVGNAASFCTWPQADVGQLTAVAEVAQQGAQRAQWAAVATLAQADSTDYDKEWSKKMRLSAVKAADVAEQYARDCARAAAALGKGQVFAHIFCKFHAENRCLKGAMCEYSHDPAILGPKPLARKLEIECIFYNKGQCTRGDCCPFPHGPEELSGVVRLKRGIANAKLMM